MRLVVDFAMRCAPLADLASVQQQAHGLSSDPSSNDHLAKRAPLPIFIEEIDKVPPGMTPQRNLPQNVRPPERPVSKAMVTTANKKGMSMKGKLAIAGGVTALVAGSLAAYKVIKVSRRAESWHRVDGAVLRLTHLLFTHCQKKKKSKKDKKKSRDDDRDREAQ
jgi:hypothetical protein